MRADSEPTTVYEPGANSEQIGEEILEAINQASLAQPPGSALRESLEARYNHIGRAVSNQDQFVIDIGWLTWWSELRSGPSPWSTQRNKTFITDGAASAKSSGTASGLARPGGGCNVDSSGSGLVDCRTSAARRSMKRLRGMLKL